MSPRLRVSRGIGGRVLVLVAVGVSVAGGGLLARRMLRLPAFDEPATSRCARDRRAVRRRCASIMCRARRTGRSLDWGVWGGRCAGPMTLEMVMRSRWFEAHRRVHGRAARPGWAAELDAPIERVTAGWRLPKSEFDRQEVTLRRLLSHTAGINVSGYPGPRPGSALPSTEASLLGAWRPARCGSLTLPAANGVLGRGCMLAQLVVERLTVECMRESSNARSRRWGWRT